jgi:hypothetical protein
MVMYDPLVALKSVSCEGDDELMLRQTMYCSPLTSDYLYSIETIHLRTNPSNDTLSAKSAFDNVKNLGQRGGNSNAFSGDSLGNVYMLMPSQNAIYIYKSIFHRLSSYIFILTSNNSSTSLQTKPYVRDPRIIWPDSASIGFDGYIYFNINQLPYQPDWNNGIDGRLHPGLILRCKLPDEPDPGAAVLD